MTFEPGDQGRPALTEQPSKLAIQVRPAVREDCEMLAKLAGQLGYESSADQIAARLEAARASDEHSVLVAQERGAEIVGWIGMFVFRPVTSDPRVEVSGLVVDEARRSQKIGQLLLQSAEEWALAKGCGTIGLHCNIVRTRAHGFYERQGYHLKKTQKLFHKVLSKV